VKLFPVEYSKFKLLPESEQRILKTWGSVPVADPIMPLWELPEKTNTVILIGGRGGMKTWGVSQFIAYQAAVNKKRCVILRDEHSLIKESILSEILQRYADIPFSTKTEKLTTGIKDKETGTELVFTKGFKASDNQKKANMKGVSNIDIAVIEEAEDLIDKDKFNTFVDSLRKDGCLVIILMNTPDIGHFLLKSYFYTNIPAPVPANCPEELKKEYDGYFEIKPKEIPGFVCIHTGFESNEFLPQHIIDRYKSYGDPASHNYNPHYYLTAIKGYASTGRKGQVLRKVKEISLKDYLALPFKEYYGQDFGTAAPAGLVGVKFDKNNCYVREINYLPMNTLSIAKLYCTLNFGLNDKIIADSADKDACEKLAAGYQAKELSQEDLMNYPKLLRGFFVEKCVKGEGSIRAGISIMDGLNLFAVKESENLWNEIRNYTYDKDKNDNLTNDPIDDFNHLIDPWRYVATDQRGKREMFGI
jgi:phage terminase large subunit